MDTSMAAGPASLHQSGPIESAAPTPPVTAAPAPRATTPSFISEISPLTSPVLAGTTGTTSAIN